MSLDTGLARLRIARDLREAEAALDEALLTQSSLLSSLINMRRATESEPFLGHHSLLRVVKSQQTLLSAGGELARVHGAMKEIQKEKCGIDECPPNKPMGVLDEQKVG